jgi:hypothetical protein
MAMTELAAQSSEIKVLKAEIDSLRRQDVAFLGDGQVFVRKTPQGQIKAVKGAMGLREKNGEIAEIQGKYMVTSKGFNTLNQITNISIVTPEKLTLPDNKIVVNPYPIIDPDSGSIAKVWVKKLAIGYGPTGNLVITSATLLYDIKMYFIQDVVKKVKANKNAGRICLESQLTDTEKASGIFLRIDGPLGVWASYENPDILKALETFINKKLFAERNAQSICERLVMSKHPALAHAAYVEASGTQYNHMTRVPVVGYMSDLTREQMLDIAAQAERGEVEINVGGQTAQVIETVGAASVEEMELEADDEERASTTEPTTAFQPANGTSPASLFETGGERL